MPRPHGRSWLAIFGPGVGLAAVLVLALACGSGRGGADPDSPDGAPEHETTGAKPAAESDEAGQLRVAGEPERERLDAFMARFARGVAPPPEPPTPAQAGSCPDSKGRDRDLGILVSPLHPAKGQEVRVIAATLAGEDALALRIELDGQPVEFEAVHRRGVPAATIARFTPSEAGKFEVVVGRDGTGMRCTSFSVRNGRYRDEGLADMTRVWPTERNWDRQEEALYSAWLRELFAGPADQDLAWKSLTEVTSDRGRNLLHDHLGRAEDDPVVGMQLEPDCADTPYFLRAYFAYKRGLPFGFRRCSRGKGKPPSCFDLRTNESPPDLKPIWIDPVAPILPMHTALVEHFFRKTVGWGVHTGNGRTAFGDSQSDLYPVALDRRGLRPGIVYADPYGHILVLVELVEPRGDKPGILFAIDGQPDASITRKRFWEGNFLWNQSDPTLGGSGFKAFRPITPVGEGEATTWVQAGDETLAKLRDYGDVSMEQRELAPLDFYDRMERLITPGTRSPFAAQEEAVDALAEAVRVRVTSVGNGLEWHADNPKDVAEMPWGHELFETSGAWEDYSTPARDLRLLIAMDVVRGFADKVRRNPDAFGLAADPALLEQTLTYLVEQRDALLADPARAVEYERSDGSRWTLRLDEILARSEAFEVAYNPNDCPEHRWGAPEGSDERSTCHRRAPEDQQAKMRAYRIWFAERRRPARGDAGPPVPELAGVPRIDDEQE
ncbi:hypothetical protein ACNOYE_24045 [Nannocystaceae bacterium ST9]